VGQLSWWVPRMGSAYGETVPFCCYGGCIRWPLQLLRLRLQLRPPLLRWLSRSLLLGLLRRPLLLL
jgi:hypothetical protein